MAIKIGTAPCSWGIWMPDNDKQVSWTQCLDEIKEVGFKFLELGPWGYLPNDPIKLKEELNKRALGLIATTLMTDLVFINNLDEIFKTLDEILGLQQHFPSAKYLVLIDGMYTDLFTGELVSKKELDDNEWNKMISNIKNIVAYVKSKSDINVVFHPHTETHVQSVEEIERFLNDTDINLCFDTGHHLYSSGGDPIEFIKKHGERIGYFHFKSCNIALRDEAKAKGWAFAQAVKSGVMCDPQSGNVDFVELTKTLEEIHFSGGAVVEQDMYPAPLGEPLKIANGTMQYLKEIGLM